MLSAAETENIVESIISSYETRIQSIETLFETSHQILVDMQDSVLNARQEREKVNQDLRENLAKNVFLRKKDFDTLMSTILNYQDQGEQEVRNLSRRYLSEQTDTVRELRENLRNFREALTKGETQKVKDFQTAIKEILTEQQQTKSETVSRLGEFQKEQQETATMLKNLLAKGRELRIKDLKLMLAEFKRQHRNRATDWEKRRQEVKDLLGEFKAKRAELGTN